MPKTGGSVKEQVGACCLYKGWVDPALALGVPKVAADSQDFPTPLNAHRWRSDIFGDVGLD